MEYKLANVHPEAKIGKNVVIEPFVTIDKDVEIGDGCCIQTNSVIRQYSKIGENCNIFPGAVIGAIPQDLKFKGEVTYVEIGKNTTVRECATINRGTAAKGKTIVGENCLLMAYSHLAHDCIVGNNVIIGNASQIAGEVIIEDFVIISGGVLVHQFVNIGVHTMIQGGSKVVKDIPPYILAGREPLVYSGINSVGLRRRSYTKEQIDRILEIYRIIYTKGKNTTQAVEILETNLHSSEESKIILNFIKNSERGIISGNITE